MGSRGEQTPGVIAPNHNISDVVAWYPETRVVFDRLGVPLRGGFFRRMRNVTVADAARASAMRLEEMLEMLTRAGPALEVADKSCGGCGGCRCGRNSGDPLQNAVAHADEVPSS
jgi:hypothetical protein